MSIEIKQQKSTDKFWADEAGAQIPYARTTKLERVTEKTVASLARTAVALNAELSGFKAKVREQLSALYDQFLQDNNGKIGKNKGNMTFYLFDRSTKIEMSINELIKFDENFIGLAKQKLDEYLDSKIDTTDAAFKALVMDAFSRQRGDLDVRKVLSLKKYADRIKDARYREAMGFIDKAITRPSSREYFRVFIKDETGAWQAVDLNFSSI